MKKYRLSFDFCAVLLIFFLSLAFTFSHAECATFQASKTAWSGYWWPYTGGGIATGIDYRGHPAPLEKYELLTEGKYPGELVSWYKGKYYDPEAPDWYGLCHAWAAAACYENCEILPSSDDNIVFRVGDKKGLLTLSHDNDIAERADGSRPDVFHFWLLNYIKDQGKAFVADLDPGEEIWSYPIYRYDMETSVAGDIESVTVMIHYADDFVSPDYMGTKKMTKVYTYDLFLDAGGAITGGNWTGGSVNDHPQRLTFPLIARTSCPYLDYDTVKALAQSRDDFLETQGIADIAPGTYNLVLLDEDSYRVNCDPGDSIYLSAEKQIGSHDDIYLVITDKDGNEVESTTITNSTPFSLLMDAQNPPYIVTLTQSDYSDPNIYTLTLDLVRSFMQDVPYIPKNGMWSGFALTNPHDAEVSGITLTTYGNDGEPLQTVLGPITLKPGEKRLFFFSDLPFRSQELPSTTKLTLMSPVPINLLNLFGNSDDSLAGFVQGGERGNHLIIADTLPSFTPGRIMFGGVENESLEDAPVTLRLYSTEGVLLDEDSETITPKGTISIIPGSYPFFSMPESGWIEIMGNQGANLSGYFYLGDTSSGRAQSLFALRADLSKKFIPHTPPPIYWITKVTLINCSDIENRVNFHLQLAGSDHGNDLNITLNPREKRTLKLQEEFGKMPGDPLYRSVLEINGEQALAGYYTYSYPSGDEASYPLVEEDNFKNELILPHVASSVYWWTGVSVCNPSSFPESVTVEPYDNEGNLMEDMLHPLAIKAGGYEVFSIRSLFGDKAPEISFLKFKAQEPEGIIGGFYLYGNPTNEMLSGANM